MRSIFTKSASTVALLVGAIFSTAQGPKVNPNTQIAWPTGCNAVGQVYSFYANACVASSSVPFTQLGDVVYGGVAGAVTVQHGPTVGSTPYVWTETPSGGTAQATAWQLPGVAGRYVGGSSDSITALDRGAVVVYTSSSTVAVSVPSAAAQGSNFVFAVKAQGAGALTLTPSAGTIDGGAMLSVASGTWCVLNSPDDVNYVSRCGGGSGGGSGGVQYMPSSTTVLFTGSSFNADDTHALSPAIPATGFSCSAGLCLVTTTSAHGLAAGQWVTLQFLTGWFAAPADQDYWSTGVSVFQVLSAGLTSTQFEVAYTLNTGSGSGGAVYSAQQWLGPLTMQEPFFSGHGNLVMVAPHGSTLAYASANYTALYHGYSPAATGNPGVLIITDDKNDYQACLTASTIEGYYTSLWAAAHADGWTVVTSSTPPSNWNFSLCPGGNEVYNNVQVWVRDQSKTAANTAGGQYWDRWIDLALVLQDTSNSALVASNGGLGPSGASLVAKYINAAFATQDSTITTGIDRYKGFYSNTGGGNGGSVYSLPFQSPVGWAIVNDTVTNNGGGIANSDYGFRLDTQADVSYIQAQKFYFSPWRDVNGPGANFIFGGNTGDGYSNLNTIWSPKHVLTGTSGIYNLMGYTAGGDAGYFAYLNNSGSHRFAFGWYGGGPSLQFGADAHAYFTGLTTPSTGLYNDVCIDSNNQIWTDPTKCANVASVPLSSVTPGSTSTGLYDFSAATQFKLPVAAGYASAASGEMGHDTTNHNWHAWANGADYLLALIPPSGITTGHCPQFSIVSGFVTLTDTGASCGGSGGPPTGAAGGDLGSTYPNPTVLGVDGVPLCTGFTPTNGQNLQYTTASSPNPCYTAATPSGGGGNFVNITSSITWTNATVSGGVATTTGAVASVTASSIPATYRHLRIYVNGQTDNAGAQSLFAQFNSDATSGHYSYRIIANGSVSGSASDPKVVVGVLSSSSIAAALGSSNTIDILDYATTNFDKMTLGHGIWVGTSNAVTDYATSGLWTSTVAISSITFSSGAGNINTNSSFTVYGEN